MPVGIGVLQSVGAAPAFDIDRTTMYVGQIKHLVIYFHYDEMGF